MATDGVTSDGSAGGPSITLSTGQTVHLPLEAEATMVGAVYTVPRKPVASLLPDAVRPIRATPGGNAAVTLLSVEYHRMGVEGIEPYDEFVVIVPATHESRSGVPYLTALTRATCGYVWSMPVTTAPAKALGVDVWGYPKVVADIAHEDRGDRRRTTVTVDGERFVELSVERPPSLDLADDACSYAVKDGDVLSVPSAFDGALGAWPFTTAVDLSLGGYERAAPLRELGLGRRALGRVSFEGSVQFHAGEPVASR